MEDSWFHRHTSDSLMTGFQKLLGLVEILSFAWVDSDTRGTVVCDGLSLAVEDVSSIYKALCE